MANMLLQCPSLENWSADICVLPRTEERSHLWERARPLPQGKEITRAEWQDFLPESQALHLTLIHSCGR